MKSESGTIEKKNVDGQLEPDQSSLALQRLSLAINQDLLKSSNFNKVTLNRINDLAYKEFLSGQKLDGVSLRNFLTFWISMKHSACEPELFLCNNGNIQAEWYKNSKRNLTIEFKKELAVCVLINGDKIWKIKESFEDLANILLAHSDRPFKWE